MDMIKGTKLVNSWANAFRTECETVFPGQGELVYYTAIAALFSQLLVMYDPELVAEQTNARLAGAAVPYRIVKLS
jgi:hypothetical protein